MGETQILGRGGRVAGSVVSSLLAAVLLGWVVRDLAVVGPPGLWWQWAGRSAGFGLLESSRTTGLDVLLLAIHAVVAVKAMRSDSAAVLLGATGALTVALRLPAVVDHLQRAGGAELFGGPAPGALATAAGSVLGGLVLIAVAGAGRRPAGPRARAGVPGRAPAAWAGTLLLLGGAVLLAWQAHTIVTYGWERYAAVYFGTGGPRGSVLLGEVGWQTVALAGFALAAGVVCLRRGRGARALGVPAALLVGGTQALVLGAYLEGSVYEQLTLVDTYAQLALVTPPVLCVLAAVVLAVLLPRPAAGDPGQAGPYGPGPAPWQTPAPGPYGAPGPR
ncbi:hypothetical protein [Streptomyces sp. BBFR102]|uniref:hypothetical protein n=1 Tax=Streptomyces sp. BBFR102 TaxID=3448171 RepID=UPI003F52A3BE